MSKIVKKGLLIGINYIGSANELNGCINDSENLKAFLIANKYLKAEEITMMNDLLKGKFYPTKQNILAQLAELVTFANNNKGSDKTVEIFFSYSGHGTNVVDKSGDEADGYDEALVPVDFQTNGMLVDDLIRSSFIDKLGPNVNVTFLCDACHSGTMCDLKYTYNFKSTNPYNADNHYKDTLCNIATISGCTDQQTSADAYIKNNDKYTYQGAMTAAFIKNYVDEISYRKLITDMRAWLVKGMYSQIPQLCTGKLVNLDSPFLLSIYNN